MSSLLYSIQLVFSPQGRTELHDAVNRGDMEEIHRLLSTSVNINSRTEIVSFSTLANVLCNASLVSISPPLAGRTHCSTASLSQRSS